MQSFLPLPGAVAVVSERMGARRRLGTAAIVLAGLAVGAGCRTGGTVRAELGMVPVRESVAVGDLMSAADRSRLERLSGAREATGGDAEYRIGPDDLLDIRVPDLLDAQAAPAGAAHLASAGAPVAGAPVFQQGFRVSAGGVVTIPMLGVVPANGLTPAGLEAEIARRLIAAGVLRAPQVSVQVAEYRSRVVAVVGAVERPGPYPVTRPGATVADLIWAAGGPSRDAGRVVEFMPATAVAAAPAVARQPAAPVPMDAASDCSVAGGAGGACPSTLELRDVRVEPAGVGRAVVLVLSRPPTGVHQLALDGPPRLVVDIDGPVPTDGRATQHLAVADAVVTGVRAALHEGQLRAVLDLREAVGPVNVRVDGSRVMVEMGGSSAPAVAPRTVAPDAETAHATGPIHMDLENLLRATPLDHGSLNPQVRAGDVISLRPAGSVLVDGWVDKPGSYPVTRGLTLTGAIAAAGGHVFAADRHHATVKRILGGGEQRSITVDLDAIARGEAADIPITDGDVVRLPASGGRMIPYGMWTVAREVVHVGGNVLLF
jgi:protein involved in polysaccharide export with SLBB domain